MDLETAPGDFISTSVCPMEYPLAAPRGLGQGHHRPDRGPEKLVLDKGEREKGRRSFFGVEGYVYVFNSYNRTTNKL